MMPDKSRLPSEQAMSAVDDKVTVHVASLNTRAATELCIRTMRLYADYPFDAIVGDGGSADGSIELLEDLAQRGWITLQRHDSRTHADWLDAWRSQATSRYLVFADSDMDFRRKGWLRDLVSRARASGAALVAADIHPLSTNVREPVAGRLVRLMPAPSTWLFLIDGPQIADINESFAFRALDTQAVPEGCIVYDTGAVLLEQIHRRGRAAVSMSASYRTGLKHYGSMTWMPLAGQAGRRKRRDLIVIQRRLGAMKALDQHGTTPRWAAVCARLSPHLEVGLEYWARIRWRAGRVLRVYRDQPILAEDFNARAMEAEDEHPPTAVGGDSEGFSDSIGENRDAL
jgi:glycosyltransferase involved in cell wall biosynthesis